jgi:hypothetical protein
MSDGGGLLQFARAEVGQPAAVTCLQCHQPVGEAYYEAAGKTVCERCKGQIEWHLAEGAGFVGFLKALAFGAAGGLLGAAAWYAVRVLSGGYQLALIAIAVGWLVGRGVNLGTAGRGGVGFQVLAVLLTYTSIVMQYVPDIWQGLAQSQQFAGPARVLALVIAVPLAFAVPFFGLPQNVIGLLIIGFGLMQAWRMNARPQVAFSGPYRVAPVAPPVEETAPSGPKKTGSRRRSGRRRRR